MTQPSHTEKSIVLTKGFIIVLAIASILLLVNGPTLVNALMIYDSSLLTGHTKYYTLLISGYVLGAVALNFLRSIYSLMNRIEHGEIFTVETVTLLYHIELHVVIVCVAAFIIGLLCHIAILIISFISAFMSLIIRIIKNIINQAVVMQEELDYTI